jgi:hypothetical protein
LQAADEVNYLPCEALEHASKMPGERGGAFKDDMRIQSWARRYAEVRPVRAEGDSPLSGLNETQVRAVAMMIGERISLVQGVGSQIRVMMIKMLSLLVPAKPRP